jgi:glycosyltransferase involved in cell wall biosynthesis
MCCGCPVVASDHVGAARDLVAPVAPQFVFPCGNVNALAAILKDALADRTKLQSIARGAVTHIQTWSPERNISATVDAIRIAIARLRRARSEEHISSPEETEKSSVHPQRQR